MPRSVKINNTTPTSRLIFRLNYFTTFRNRKDPLRGSVFLRKNRFPTSVHVRNGRIFAESNNVYACGSNTDGQLGLDNIDMVNTPTKLPHDILYENEVIQKLSAGSQHSAALTGKSMPNMENNPRKKRYL